MRMDDARTLFGYNSWANARILDAAERVPSASFHTAALGSCNLHDTLKHILRAEARWRLRWQGSEVALLEFPDRFPAVEALRARWREEDQHLHAYLGTLHDTDLSRSLVHRRSDGSTITHKLGYVLQHVVNHGTQHRSEVALLLTELGQSPREMDFLLYTGPRL